MKIVHAVYSMEVGGAEMLVAQLCRTQRAHGHQVSVCAYSELGVLGEALRHEGVDVHVLGTAHPARTMLRYLRHFLKTRPDVVHCHNPAPTLQAALPARIAGASCVVATRHSLVSPPFDFAGEVKFSLMSWFIDSIVGICDITCDNLRRAPLSRKSRVVRVYNGAAAIVGREGGEHDKEKFTLLFIGRLAIIKDLPTLLRAMALAVPRVPELQLFIVGDGPVRADLENLAGQLGISERVTFYGQQTKTDRFFHSADALIMSSTSEGLPISLLQAMSAGKPAVLTDVGGMREVVQRSGGGLLVPVGDAQAMAEAIVQMATSADMRNTMGARAAVAYHEDFTLEKMDAAYMQLYRGARPIRSDTEPRM